MCKKTKKDKIKNDRICTNLEITPIDIKLREHKFK